MDIGRNIGGQNSKLIVNLDSMAALQKTVNQLRKPSFDSKYFNTISSPEGWNVSFNDDAIRNIEDDGAITHYLPFDTRVNLRDPGKVPVTGGYQGDAYISIKIRDGVWYRTKTSYGFKTTNDHSISSTLSTDFSSYLEDTGPTQLRWWTLELKEGETMYIYLELLDTSDDLILKKSSTIPNQYNTQSIRLLAKVRLTGGTLDILQYFHGDVYSEIPPSVSTVSCNVVSNITWDEYTGILAMEKVLVEVISKGDPITETITTAVDCP